MFTVFKTFLNGQTVFRYVSKRVRNNLKNVQKNVTREPGFTGGSTRGQVGDSQGSARVHQGVSRGSGRGQPKVSQGSTRGNWYIFIRPNFLSENPPDPKKIFFCTYAVDLIKYGPLSEPASFTHIPKLTDLTPPSSIAECTEVG